MIPHAENSKNTFSEEETHFHYEWKGMDGHEGFVVSSRGRDPRTVFTQLSTIYMVALRISPNVHLLPTPVVHHYLLNTMLAYAYLGARNKQQPRSPMQTGLLIKSTT
jgi:hypothetical protein